VGLRRALAPLLGSASVEAGAWGLLLLLLRRRRC
jgi:hypothetical protein